MDFPVDTQLDATSYGPIEREPLEMTEQLLLLYVVGQHANDIVENLGKASVDLQDLLGTTAAVTERARAESTQKRRMSGQDTEISIFAGQLRFSYLLVHVKLLGRGDF